MMWKSLCSPIFRYNQSQYKIKRNVPSSSSCRLLSLLDWRMGPRDKSPFPNTKVAAVADTTLAAGFLWWWCFFLFFMIILFFNMEGDGNGMPGSSYNNYSSRKTMFEINVTKATIGTREQPTGQGPQNSNYLYFWSSRTNNNHGFTTSIEGWINHTRKYLCIEVDSNYNLFFFCICLLFTTKKTKKKP